MKSKNKLVSQLLISSAVLGGLLFTAAPRVSADSTGDTANNATQSETNSSTQATQVALPKTTTESTSVGSSDNLNSQNTVTEAPVTNENPTANEDINDTDTTASANTTATDNSNTKPTTDNADTFDTQAPVANPSVQVTDLGNATDQQLTDVKAKAAEVYLKTGVAQQVTAVADTTDTSSLPTGVTGQAVIHYVDALTGEELTIPNGGAVGIKESTYGQPVNGQLTYNSKLPSSMYDENKVTPSVADLTPYITNYGISGYIDADGNTVTKPSDIKLKYMQSVDITVLYSPLSDLVLQYVDENDPSHVLASYVIALGDSSQVADNISGGETYDVSYYHPDIPGYTYDPDSTLQSNQTGLLDHLQTKDDPNPLIVTYAYKQNNDTASDDASSVTTGDSNWVPYNGNVNFNKDLNGHLVAPDMPGYTVIALFQSPNQLGYYAYAYAIQNKPVIVQYVNESTGKQIISPVTLEATDANNAWTSEQKDFPNLTFDKVIGATSGTYDALNRTVTYLYKQKGELAPGIHVYNKVQVPDAVSVTPDKYYDNTNHEYGYSTATVTRTINYTSDDPDAVLPAPEVQTVTYNTTTDKTTGDSAYTPFGIYPSLEVPTVAGYTPDIKEIDQSIPRPGTTLPDSTTITVTYKKNPAAAGNTGNPTDPTNKNNVPGNTTNPETTTYPTGNVTSTINNQPGTTGNVTPTNSTTPNRLTQPEGISNPVTPTEQQPKSQPGNTGEPTPANSNNVDGTPTGDSNGHQPVTPATLNQTGAKTDANTNVTLSNQTKTLPQTSENSDAKSAILGIGLLATLGSLLGFGTKKRREN